MKANPFPIILAWRAKTGCRQHVFKSLAEFERWAARRAINDELIRAIYVGADRKAKFDSGHRHAANVAREMRGWYIGHVCR